LPYFSKASVKKKTSKFAPEISCKLFSGAFSFLYVQPILFNLSGGGEPHNVIEDGHRESTASLANRSGIMAEKKHQLTALGIVAVSQSGHKK
jgi:hypothetical protein